MYLLINYNVKMYMWNLDYDSRRTKENTLRKDEMLQEDFSYLQQKPHY